MKSLGDIQKKLPTGEWEDKINLLEIIETVRFAPYFHGCIDNKESEIKNWLKNQGLSEKK